MKLLVCGTRGARYDLIDFDKIMRECLIYVSSFNITEIIEGCCPNSADVLAEEWAKQNSVPIKHFPATSNNYLKRNIEMVEEADEVLAFFDGWSYGTAHTIANAVMRHKPVRIVEVKK